EEVEAPPREVDVMRLDLVEFSGSVLRLHVECGSGTYVRSLARDLGEKLGCGAHLTALRRVWVDPFRDPVMHTLTQLETIAAEGSDALDALLLPVQESLVALPALQASPDQVIQLRQGKRIVQSALREMPICRALDEHGRLVALVEIDAGGEVRVKRGFNI